MERRVDLEDLPMTEVIQNEILCTICRSSTLTAGNGHQFALLQSQFGDGALHDGPRYRVVLCERCFFSTLAYLRQERRSNLMFDGDFDFNDQHLGLVATDD